MDDLPEAYTLSGADAARLLGVSRETVRTYVEQGKLPYREERRGLRRYYFLRPSDVQRLADELRAPPPEHV